MRIILFIAIVLAASGVSAQHNFNLTNKSLMEFRALEDSLGSEFIGFEKTNVAQDYFPTAQADKEYFPATFKRTNDSFYPYVWVKYYYSEDSTVLATSYDWNISNYVKNYKTGKSELKKETKRKKEYEAKYNSIKQELIANLGKPTFTDEGKNSKGIFNKLEWENEEIKALLLLKFSNSLMELPGGIAIGSFDIRVKIDYKKR